MDVALHSVAENRWFKLWLAGILLNALPHARRYIRVTSTLYEARVSPQSNDKAERLPLVKIKITINNRVTRFYTSSVHWRNVRARARAHSSDSDLHAKDKWLLATAALILRLSFFSKTVHDKESRPAVATGAISRRGNHMHNDVIYGMQFVRRVSALLLYLYRYVAPKYEDPRIMRIILGGDKAKRLHSWRSFSDPHCLCENSRNRIR